MAYPDSTHTVELRNPVALYIEDTQIDRYEDRSKHCTSGRRAGISQVRVGGKAEVDGIQASCSQSWEPSPEISVWANDVAEGRAPRTERKSSRHTSQDLVRAVT